MKRTTFDLPKKRTRVVECGFPHNLSVGLRGVGRTAELELPDIPCRYRGPNGSVLSSSHQFQDAAIRGRYRYLELHQKTKRVLPAPVTASGPAGR